MKYLLAFTAIAMTFFNSAATADLVFSAPPREHKGAGSKTYGPLAERLTTVLGEKVVYEQPASWAEYSDKLRNDKYDIIFDGPHFTSWRIKRIGHQPVVRLPGHLAFNIVTKKDNKRVDSVKSLRAIKVCTFASPNLTASVLLDLFRNEIAVPIVVAIRGSMGDVLKGLEVGDCEAAVLRDQFFDKTLSEEQRAGLKVLYKTRQFPNQGISVSSKLSPEQVDRIAMALQQEDASLKPITARFARTAKHFVPSESVDYAGISSLLEGVVWGW